jgi:hypothetical protein
MTLPEIKASLALQLANQNIDMLLTNLADVQHKSSTQAEEITALKAELALLKTNIDSAPPAPMAGTEAAG